MLARGGKGPDAHGNVWGECWQFDALFDLLTGREHLELYARIKGIPEEHINTVVEGKIQVRPYLS